MCKYIIRKVIIALVTLWVIATTVFFLMKCLPGNPFEIEESELPIGVAKQLEKTYGLDMPLWKQYTNYIKNIVKLDFGYSFRDRGVKVSQIIGDAAKYSIIIGFGSICISLIMGVLFGIVLVWCKNIIVNKFINFMLIIGIAVPNFVFAVLYVYWFGWKLRILSVGDLNSCENYIGPIFVLSLYQTAFVARLVKTNMLKTLQENYITVLRTYGVSEKKILFKYALKDVLIPVITYTASMVASVVMGSFAVEKIFSIPGLGKIFIDGVGNRDYPIVFGITLIYASVYIVVVLLADICYSIVDHRVIIDVKK